MSAAGCGDNLEPEDDVCGDGIVGETEECDDGNDDETDGCLSTCVSAQCGDGLVTAGLEECDGDGAGTPGETAECDADCTFAECGDGDVNTLAGEECDDGNDELDDACPSGPDGTCAPPECGDGVVTGDEMCDPGSDGCCNATCDGALVVDTECRASAGSCDIAEVCDGTAFQCPVDDFEPDTTECRVAAGSCDIAEFCTGSSADCPTDDIEPDTTECRVAAGDCDIAEFCDGTTVDCPSDDIEPDTTVCRADNGLGCDVEERCDGATVDCPSDDGVAVNTECRADNAGGCDVAEVCDGTSAACPTDVGIAANTECRADNGFGCDVAEVCDGSSAACPTDVGVAANTECRADNGGGCDVAEVCDGSSAGCPSDVGIAANTECRADNGGGCDVAEVCDGSSDACPSDVGVAVNTECRADNGGGCDVAEVCDGSSDACPSDVGVAVNTECRSSTGECDLAEVCDGGSDACPTDGFEADMTVCTDDGDTCTDDYCDTGSCTHPIAALDCGDGNICGSEQCDDGMAPANLDGCDTMCVVESGYACPNEPSDCELTPVAAGDIVITEIMKDPTEVGDSVGEWIEVHNPTAMDFELYGLEVSDADTNSFTIDSSVIVIAGGYAVLGNNAELATNGNVTVDYEYSGTVLANGTDEVIITNTVVPQLIDEVYYSDADFPDDAGRSMSLEPDVEDDDILNNNGGYWCSASSVLNASDFGTPGAQNDSCASLDCLTILMADPSAPSGVYVIDPDGPGGVDPMPAECDMVTDGGGWTLVLNYVHDGGTNPALDIRTTDLPTINSSTLGDDEQATRYWGHAGNGLFSHVTQGAPAELRFYGETGNHTRIMDFTTDDQGTVSYFETGLGSCFGMNGGNNTTLLAPHTANLPTAIANFWTNEGDIAMTNFPFWLGSTYHWGIAGDGFRWEVDDYPDDQSQDTIHRIWVRALVEVVDLTPPDGTLMENDDPFWSTKGYRVVASQNINVTGFEWWINLPSAATVSARIYDSVGTLVASGTAASGTDSEAWYRSDISYTMLSGQTYSIVMFHSAASTGTFDRLDGATQGFTVSPYVTDAWSRSSGSDVAPVSDNSWFPMQRIISVP